MKHGRLFSFFAVVAIFLMTVSDAAHSAQASPPNGKSPKQVQISVEFVDVAPAIAQKEARQIPAGKNHDALLLTALGKAGGQVLAGPQVQTADQVEAQVQFQQGSSTLSITATPRIHADGTIMVRLKTRRDTVNTDGISSTPITIRSATTRTFQDGQTLLISELDHLSKTKPMAHLVFAKVATVPSP